MSSLWTIGHSALSSDAIVAALVGFGIAHLADVRRFPASRRLPHVGREPLSAALAAVGTGYSWFDPERKEV